MNLIPALYHPTTLVLVDDDPEFLTTLTLTLSSQFKCHMFTVPKKAEQFLTHHHAPFQSMKSRFLNIDYQDLGRFSVNIEIAQIHQEVWNRQRFSRTAILIVDYDMPSMNGLELIRRLKSSLPIKAILLTGEADQQTAITAFNHGEIDRFVSKSAADCNERTIQYIYQLQWEYFRSLSNAVLEPLIAEGSHPLQDVHFQALFQRIMREQKIIEFYLLDESASFIMLNTQGQPTWLLVRTEVDMELFYDIANMEEDVPENVLEALRKKEKLYFYHNNRP